MWYPTHLCGCSWSNVDDPPGPPHNPTEVNLQEKLKILVMVGITTKKVGAEPGH
ncbi:hypothetical protein MTR_1g025690 [Medicago truncatula]|uniref:Uncharacterized protein n=1 Tax=Medicago truncatula TaxID=3880 RepID=G7I7S6_MEDTR|nr:hypothetical protein MTR_1g025690 [Medicago truncatula]